MPRRKTLALCAFIIGGLIALIFTTPALADNTTMPQIRFDGRAFQPNSVSVIAHKPFRMRVTNSSTAAIEFESFELHRERVVPPGETITVFMPSLAPGDYSFFDDFHHRVPQGVIVSR